MVLTGGIVWCLRVHDVHSCWNVVTLALTSEDDLALPVGATVGIDDLRIGRVDSGNRYYLQSSVADLLCIGEGDLLNDGRLVKTSVRSKSTSILDEEDLITSRVPGILVSAGVNMGGSGCDRPTM